MTAGRTGLVSQYDLAELDLGKSFNRQQRMPVYQLMFGATTLYKPDVSDYRGIFLRHGKTCFVFWKTDDQPDHIPKWDDPGIQAEVLRVWKLDEARKLAMKRADELKAEAAANAGKSLKNLASGKKKDFKVFSPPPFSFLMQMYGQQPAVGRGFRTWRRSVLRCSVHAEGVQPGPEPGGRATNLPETEIYVVRAVEFTPFEELWSDFISDADDWSLYTLFTPNASSEKTAGLFEMIGEQQREVSQAWLDKLHADAGLKWEKQP